MCSGLRNRIFLSLPRDVVRADPLMYGTLRDRIMTLPRDCERASALKGCEDKRIAEAEEVL